MEAAAARAVRPGAPSIGLIVSGASPSFLDVTIITGKGGPGGNAGAGGVGGSGGNGGPGGGTHQATCVDSALALSFTPPLFSPGLKNAPFFGGVGGTGGRGGNGGRGGDGAPGAGGPSIGVWCERRVLETFPVPQLGPGGDGGVGPGGVAGPEGREIDFLNCR